MPDWAPVPTLPSVQATVASAQPAHLTGVDHIDSDGFGKGFTSVMNMRTIAGKMELWKLLQQATDDKGTMHWDKFYASAAKDKNPDLPLVAPDYLATARKQRDEQLTAADDIANQQAYFDVLKKKHQINQDEAQRMQKGIEARAIGSGVMVGSGDSGISANPAAVPDANTKTMLHHMTNINDGRNQYSVFQTPTNQLVEKTYNNYVTPDTQANLNATTQKAVDTSHNDTTTTTYGIKVHPDATVNRYPLGVDKASQEGKSNIYTTYLQQAPKHLADFNVNQNNLLNAISLANKSENITSKTPELARIAQFLGMNVKDNETPPMVLSKYLAQVEQKLHKSGNDNSVAALETAKKALGENAPYKVIALAAMAEYENEIADALKYATAQNTKDFNGYDQIYNKTILPHLMDYARAIAYRKLKKFDQNASRSWGDTMYSINGKNFGSRLGNSLNEVDGAIKNPKDPRYANIAKTMGYGM